MKTVIGIALVVIGAGIPTVVAIGKDIPAVSAAEPAPWQPEPSCTQLRLLDGTPSLYRDVATPATVGVSCLLVGEGIPTDEQINNVADGAFRQAAEGAIVGGYRYFRRTRVDATYIMADDTPGEMVTKRLGASWRFRFDLLTTDEALRQMQLLPLTTRPRDAILELRRLDAEAASKALTAEAKEEAAKEAAKAKETAEIIIAADAAWAAKRKKAARAIVDPAKAAQ